MSSMFLAKLVPLASLFVSGVWAQLDMAECKTGYDWNRNSLGQDPCTVGSTLDATCRGLVVYNYPPLNASQYYLPPRKDHDGDLKCDCNTVMYNLYMACASCQEGEIYSWTAWIAACESVYVAQYPGDIPQGTAVPRWVYSNVTASVNQTYNQPLMISIGRDPEELPNQLTTVISSSTSPGKTTLGPSITKSSTGQPSPTNDSSNNTTKSERNVGAIVGGVVGSVVPLTILAVGAFFYARHRRHQQAPQQIQNADAMDPFNQRQTSMYGPPMASSPFTPYNPSDPSTFPPQSPQSSVTYTTAVHNARGTYSGVPEV